MGTMIATALSDGVTIAIVGVLGAGFMTWMAYVSKMLVDHAKWMAAANGRIETTEEQVDRLDRQSETHDRQIADLNRRPPLTWR